ncbi:glycoside hydrolase 64/thaumatin family protein [Myxococcus qinghaiensis]|uniref:hypothetical protein n=1 Tax=Myxococcus qinghaiensis TaxID=2906758 RepID=UPI0020A78CD8|nr:hypothetical protein [Myxococcus qinghaiensis]MCP3166193.1 hypothetical protein [Myxococcus qinghaiensis]
MALSPLSRPVGSFSAPSVSPRSELSSQALPPRAKESSAQSLFQKDGFESAGGLKSAEGLQQLVKMLASQVQVLGELAQALGADKAGGPGKFGDAGIQPRVGGVRSPGIQGEGAPSLGGLDGAQQAGLSSFEGGVPDLGAEGSEFGGVPDLGSSFDPGLSDLGPEAIGVPDLGAESSIPDSMLPPMPGAPVASQKALAGTPTEQSATPVDASQKAAQPNGVKKDGNTLTLNNDGNKPMTVNFTPNAGEKAVDSITLQPGENRTVKFPEGWSGNFRTDTGDGKNATLGEVKFNGGHGQTYYDVSYIEGHNTAMTMAPESGGRKSGTLDNLLASAPDAVKAKGPDGSAYGIKKTTTSDVQDPSVVDFFRKHVGADQGYVIPKDDASTLGSGDSNIVVHLKNLT